jgi:hypothetical protein
MLKLAVAATVSIAYILSTSNIADAKSLRVEHTPNHNLLSERVSLSEVSSLESELKAIHNKLTKIYAFINKPTYIQGKDTMDSEDYGRGSEYFRVYEVKKLKLLDFRKNTSSGTLRNIDLAAIEMTSIKREYVFKVTHGGNVLHGKWVLHKESQNVEQLDLLKQNGKWLITNNSLKDYNSF